MTDKPRKEGRSRNEVALSLLLWGAVIPAGALIQTRNSLRAHLRRMDKSRTYWVRRRRLFRRAARHHQSYAEASFGPISALRTLSLTSLIVTGAGLVLRRFLETPKTPQGKKAILSPLQYTIH